MAASRSGSRTRSARVSRLDKVHTRGAESQSRAVSWLKERLEPTLARGTPEQLEELLHQVLSRELSREAIRQIENSVLLSSVDSGRLSLLDNDRKRQIRIWLARMLGRSGYYRHGSKLLSTTELKTASDHLLAGWFDMAFGDLDRAISAFALAWKLDPKNKAAHASYLHALGHAGDPEQGFAGLKQLNQQDPELDARGLMTVRMGELLRVAGRPAEGFRLIQERLSRLEGEPPELFLNSTNHVYLLHELGSLTAVLEGPELARPWYIRALHSLFAVNPNYPILVGILKRMVAAGIQSKPILDLLQGIALRIPETDPHRRFQCPLQASISSRRVGPSVAGEPNLILDLSRDEYQLGSQTELRFGIPLEVELVGWVQLISSALEQGVGPSLNWHVPRPLLVDLLWSDAPADIDQLEMRLTKLVSRALEAGLPIEREAGTHRLRGTLAESGGVELRMDVGRRPPSYFGTTQDPSAEGFARHYGMSPSNARKVRARLLELGVRPLPARGLKKAA